VTELPPIVKGEITVPPGPGVGTALQPDVVKRKDVHVRRTTAADI
jgi:L-alanine-DL-glutamate epimerase-like enolase superfamily enzyme